MAEADERSDAAVLELVARWHGGDEAALDELVDRHLAWISQRVRPRLGPGLRRKLETQDVVQESLMEFLRYGPRVEVESAAELRALLLRIVETTIRDRHDWFHARRRAMSRELSISRAGSREGAGGRSATLPPEAAARNELVDRMRLALELLDPEDRQVVVLRALEGRDFDSIGRELELTPDAARMRFRRALPKLAARTEMLRTRDSDRYSDARQ